MRMKRCCVRQQHATAQTYRPRGASKLAVRSCTLLYKWDDKQQKSALSSVFQGYPLACAEKTCYNAVNIRAGPLVCFVRGMSIKGAFLSMQIVVKSSYPKGWLDYEGQVEKLRKRGLEIADAEVAKQFLAYSNYYRFTGFRFRFLGFRDSPAKSGRCSRPYT